MIAWLAFRYEAQGSTNFFGRSGPGDEVGIEFPERPTNSVVFSVVALWVWPIIQSCKKVEF